MYLMLTQVAEPRTSAALHAVFAMGCDIVSEAVAKHLLGANWMPDYVANANNGGIERVLV